MTKQWYDEPAARPESECFFPSTLSARPTPWVNHGRLNEGAHQMLGGMMLQLCWCEGCRNSVRAVIADADAIATACQS